MASSTQYVRDREAGYRIGMRRGTRTAGAYNNEHTAIYWHRTEHAEADINRPTSAALCSARRDSSVQYEEWHMTTYATDTTIQRLTSRRVQRRQNSTTYCLTHW